MTLKKSIFTGCLAIAIAVSAVVWLQAAPAVGPVTVSPMVVGTGPVASVSVAAAIADVSLLPTSVNLLRVDVSGRVLANLGRMYDDGTHGDSVADDKKYTLAVSVTETVPGRAVFQVSAAFRGELRRTVSPSVAVLVLAPPATFSVNPRSALVGGPLSLNNFLGNYQQGGVIPVHGAEIDVTAIPLPPPPLNDYIAQEVLDSLSVSTRSMVVSGVSCTEVTYTDMFSATLSYKNIAVYCPAGTRLYKFYLSFVVGNPDEAQFRASFQQLLNSVSF
ncbi:MAG: hypothetical protein ABL986_07975 [Vicinamibacterales bacterium]